MEYVSGKPYFFEVNKKIRSYNYLNKNIKCEILIVGGGINGAICNYFLSQKHNVVLVEKARLGAGCTSCATALLEYQLDDFASELLKTMSEEEIVNCYKLGLKSIDMIEKFVKRNGNKCRFKRRPTLMYSADKKDRQKMIDEYNFRIKNGFKCKFINDINNEFNFKLDTGIYCENGGAEVDPYLFEKELIEKSKNQNKIFENTEIVDIKKDNGIFVSTTKYGEKITSSYVVVASGFNFELVPNDLCTRYISYTIVTNPLKNLKLKNNTLIQDLIEPYHYLRKLPDDRIIYGGEDVLIENKIDENLANKKYQSLINSLKNMFSKFANDIKAEYCFCGAFGSTKNNMGLIGKNNDGIFDFISCGANGIINAIRGVKLIENIINKNHDKFKNVFSPKRNK